MAAGLAQKVERPAFNRVVVGLYEDLHRLVSHVNHFDPQSFLGMSSISFLWRSLRINVVIKFHIHCF